MIHTVGVIGDTTAAAIRRYHVAPAPIGSRCAGKGAFCPLCKVVHGCGWRDIGYHYVVRKDGTVELGRPLTKAGAHTERANDTVGIVVAGDGDREPWTQPQWAASIELCRVLCDAHAWIPDDAIHGHREAPARLAGAAWTAKTCPGRLVDMNYVRNAVALRLALFPTRGA